MTRAEKSLFEETRRQVLAVLEPLEHTCRLARSAAGGEEPELGAEYLLDTIADIRPKLPALRRALAASKAIP